MRIFRPTRPSPTHSGSESPPLTAPGRKVPHLEALHGRHRLDHEQRRILVLLDVDALRLLPAAVKKGVSAEEKQVRILSIFSESQSVFNLKEVEKLGAKKGVVQQTIKDINQLLVDDGKVDTDKIGSGNFYWSFASKQTHFVLRLAGRQVSGVII